MNFKKIFVNLATNKEFAIVALIVVILAMMVIPLPHAMMDIMIAFNISLTVIVLMAVIYMSSPLKLTSFPTILLMLAMLRIGITVSTSRLILLDGNAGQIVSTFGDFVVGGNLIVGIIIFTIVTLINFIVITKGSERVAEVAARFSLDAMPGKQMSIDADLRSNTITAEQAKAMRKELGLESKLYGAMDGAMKFVKGDAIASMIDIIINLGGGLLVGMVQQGMDFSSALQTYSILTIGDGLVQQIPALLISLTAGLMITRVSEADEKQTMGENLVEQLFKNNRPLFAASLILLILALIPGMPSEVFIGIFIALNVLAFTLKRGLYKSNAGNLNENSTLNEIKDHSSENKTIPTNFESWKLSPLLLNISSNLKKTAYMDDIKQSLLDVQYDIMMDLGVEMPTINICYDNSMKDNYYQIRVFEIPIANARLYPKSILLLEDDESIIDGLNIRQHVKNTADFGMLNKGIWVDKECEDKCLEYKFSYLTNSMFIKEHIKYILKAHVSEFLGMQEVKNLMDKMLEYQDLIRELLRMLQLNKITEILQRLIAEDISIRNFKTILDAMLEWSQNEKDIVVITEQVRKSLGRYIGYKFSNGTGVISCFMLESEFEDMVRDAIRFNASGSYLELDPSSTTSFIENLEVLYQNNSCKNMQVKPVIVTQLDIRRYARSLIEKKLPFMHVLSFQELEGHVQYNVLGVVSISV